MLKDIQLSFKRVITYLELMQKNPSACWECPNEDLQKYGFENGQDPVADPASIAKVLKGLLNEIEADYEDDERALIEMLS